MRPLRTVSWTLPLLLVLGALAACAGSQKYPKVHPEEVSGAPLCSECHSDWQGAYDHRQGFARSHRFYTAQDSAVCETCHVPSFCADCHGEKQELKPSDMYKDQPWRDLPHRGDYITRHKIDGKLNPALCFKCHGRKADARCRECHR